MLFRLPQAKRVIENPSPGEVKELAAKMPTARPTKYGNLNVQTEVLARSKRSTYLVTDRPDGQNQSITADEGATWADRQDEYIAGREMVQVDGYIGAANANIAAMQQQLYFGPPEEDFEPELTVIYTPNLKAKGFPDDRLIMVDLEQGVTRVFNSDYFGESKKVGLSGTGKTTTTFTRQNGSLPVQDDFVAWMPDGRVYVTENGCFAKTYGLNPEDEPAIHGAVTQPDSYLENVSQQGDEIDFYDESYTQNGRATFSFDVIESAAEREIERAD